MLIRAVYICCLLIVVSSAPIEKFLFDSTLFQGADELNWDKEAYGEAADALPSGWKEQSFSQKNGDVWRVHFVCDIASANPDNWLRLPLIRRDEANRVTIRIEYTIRECKKYPGEIRSCKETFQLWYTEAASLVDSRPANFSESNYKYLKTIAPNSDLSGVQNNNNNQDLRDDDNSISRTSSKKTTTTSSSHESSSSPFIYRTEVDLPLKRNSAGVYLIFRDQGACVSLLSIKVFYTLCSAQVNNLVVYPKTPTGSNLTDLVQRSGNCVPNAESKSGTPFAYCQTNGNWFFVNSDEFTGTSMCFCRPGFYYYPPGSQCLACPPGKYKSELSNRVECSQCPENSYSLGSTASTGCKCLDGHYRVKPSDLTTPCLAYPKEPQNLTLYYLDQTSMKLRWNRVDHYDASQLKYKVDCFKCHRSPSNVTNVSNIRKSSSSNSACHDKTPCESYIQVEQLSTSNSSSSSTLTLDDNQLTLKSLDSNTQYLIELYAEHVDGLFKTRTVDMLIRTSEPVVTVESLVFNVSAYQFVDLGQIALVWKSIDNDNENTQDDAMARVIRSYEIRYWPLGFFNKAGVLRVRGPASNFTFRNAVNPSIMAHNLYVFQMRAETSTRGWSDYTRPVESVKILNSREVGEKSSNLVNDQLANLILNSMMISSSSKSPTIFPPTILSTRQYIYDQYLQSISKSPSSPSSSSLLKSTELQNSFQTTMSAGVPPFSSSSTNLTFYLTITLLVALALVLVVLSVLAALSRSGRISFFADLLLKPQQINKQQATNTMMNEKHLAAATTMMSSHNKMDTLIASSQYNQLGICSSNSTAGTTSTTSGGSSPVWPGSHKTYIDPHTYEDPTKIVSLFARELQPASIIIEMVIGGGEFGDVCKGRLKGGGRRRQLLGGLSPSEQVVAICDDESIDNDDEEHVVAIKTLKGAATEQNRCDFLTEASIMAQFNNDHVIRLEGVVTQSQPLMIVTEYMENGSLDVFLRNNRHLSMPQLVRILRDVSNGMRYLSDMNYIHRDLAARNILVNRQLVCKVADFGLSRELVDLDSCEYTTKGGKIPIRWTAPEACTFRKYSAASDVWSFGVLAWEVLSFAERPYWDWENKEVVRAVQEAAYRLPPPANTPECLYKLMRHCWQEDRQRRPRFVEIQAMLDDLLNKFADQMTRPSRMKELLPINPRHPTQVQLTRTRHLLSQLKLEVYADGFESAGLGNLSNLFQLDGNDLFFMVGMHSVLEQRVLLDKLKLIYDNFMLRYQQQIHFGNSNTLNSQTSYNMRGSSSSTLKNGGYLV